MILRVALFVVPLITSAVAVVVLNGIDASPGVAVVSLAAVAVAGAAPLGYFADRLPELPGALRRHGRGAGSGVDPQGRR